MGGSSPLDCELLLAIGARAVRDSAPFEKTKKPWKTTLRNKLRERHGHLQNEHVQPRGNGRTPVGEQGRESGREAGKISIELILWIESILNIPTTRHAYRRAFEYH